MPMTEPHWPSKSGSAVPEIAASTVSASDSWSAMLAGFLGWTLDAFDFFLVVYCLTAIGKDFHQSDAAMSLSVFVTLAFRPVGAFILGLMADRYGRRLPLMIDLVFYSIVEVATGFAHNFTNFLILRALFGIGMGGEWGVGASLAMEKVSAKWRGVLSGLLQQGYALGNLLAAFCFFFLFERWGWRPLFFLGGLPALLACSFECGEGIGGLAEVETGKLERYRQEALPGTGSCSFIWCS